MAAWASTADHLSMKQTNQGAQLIPPAHRQTNAPCNAKIPALFAPIPGSDSFSDASSWLLRLSLTVLAGWEAQSRASLALNNWATAWAFNLVSRFLKYFCDVFPTVSTTSWTCMYSSRTAVHALKCLIFKHCSTVPFASSNYAWWRSAMGIDISHCIVIVAWRFLICWFQQAVQLRQFFTRKNLQTVCCNLS